MPPPLQFSDTILYLSNFARMAGGSCEHSWFWNVLICSFQTIPVIENSPLSCYHALVTNAFYRLLFAFVTAPSSSG